MEKKVYYNVMWFTYCANGFRSYSREYELLEDAILKLGSLFAKENVYCIRVTERVRTFVDGKHVHTSIRIIDQVDKYIR